MDAERKAELRRWSVAGENKLVPSFALIEVLDALDTAEARAERAESEARRFYLADGSYVEQEPADVIKARIKAAQQIRSLEQQVEKLSSEIDTVHEAAKARYCDLPVSSESWDLADAFATRWFSANRDESDVHELARLLDAVKADATRELIAERDRLLRQVEES